MTVGLPDSADVGELDLEFWNGLWQQLKSSCVQHSSMVKVTEPGGRLLIHSWPYGQFLNACQIRARITGSHTDLRLYRSAVFGLQSYWRGESYTASPMRWGRRFYDDAAWLGLLHAQAHAFGIESDLAEASRLARFISRAQDKDGGVLWVERGDTWNACSTGSFGILAASVGRDEFDRRALAAREFMWDRLVMDNGLAADWCNAAGTVQEHFYPYNQGLLLGLEVSCGDRAQDALRAGLECWDADGLAVNAAAFSGIWARNVLRAIGSGAVEGPEADKALAVVDEYLAIVTAQASVTGEMLEHVRRYDSGRVLDACVLLALVWLRTSPELWPHIR